jgi:UDP-glucose 4-epimerase
MNVLITGGAGFIGSNLAEHFQGRANVRILDDLRTGHLHNLAGLKAEFIRGSIIDLPTVHAAVQDIDYVFHLAAFVSVPESVRNPRACVETNVIGLLNLLEAGAQAGVKKLCFSSSAAVYGDNPSVPKREEMCPEPRSAYAMTKLDGEFYCRQFTEEGRLETVALRFFNVFGPRQHPGGSYAAAVPIFFRQALAGEPLTIYGDGGQTRDFIFVKDIVAALEFVATTSGLTGVFNAGYGKEITILELAKQILALTGSNSKIQFEPVRPGDIRHSRSCVQRLADAGFSLSGTLEEGLKRTLYSIR